jgi:hypothetical protein
MGIDRIGRTPPPAPDPEAGGASRPGPTASNDSTFRVPGTQASGTLPSSDGRGVDPTRAAGAPSTAPERLRSGDVDLQGYVDLKVDEATSHLSALPPAELASIRSALRDRMAADPSLVELLQTATGQPPLPRDD